MLAALLLLPARLRPVPRMHLLVLVLPSAWLLLGLARLAEFGGDRVHPALFAVGLLSYLVCVPYAAYLILRLLQPDLLELGGLKAKLALAAVAVFFLAAGYGIGRRNDLFLNCEDFQVAGDEPPGNCRPAPTR